jgi:23S rRNA U2552 (ribose-2'-O)-methylase RlmE/FtsJ
MYRYKIDSSFDKIPLELNIIKAPLNKQGFADLLSINLEYTCKLNRAKNRINDYSSSIWEEVKKHTNPYEFIYAFNTKHKGNDYRSVSMIKPLSRSFFKMIEMIHEFCPHILNEDTIKSNEKDYQKNRKKTKQIIFEDDDNKDKDNYEYNDKDNDNNNNKDNNNDNDNDNNETHVNGNSPLIPLLISVHIAEGPGGFIEAVRFVRKGKYDDHAFGMTLIDNKYTNIFHNYNNSREIETFTNKGARGAEALALNPLALKPLVPGWKQSNHFLLNNPEVHIINGADGTGDIYKPENIHFLNNEMRQVGEGNKECSGAHLITADGGFDFSVEYNYQEQSSCKLIFSQILAAIKCQRIGGTFICKFFDINLYFTVEMLYLLYSVYETVTIYKPFTSRIANSEKYIICSNFRGIDSILCETLFDVLNQWNGYNSIETINQMFKEIPILFIERIKEINMEIVNSQISSINNAINIIKKQKFVTNSYIYSSEMTVEKQIKYAKEWCKRYNIPYKY